MKNPYAAPVKARRIDTSTASPSLIPTVFSRTQRIPTPGFSTIQNLNRVITVTSNSFRFAVEMYITTCNAMGIRMRIRTCNAMGIGYIRRQLERRVRMCIRCVSGYGFSRTVIDRKDTRL